MTLWQWFTNTLPLNDERDAMARVGCRFLWCTAPYFIIALSLASFGNAALLRTPLALFMVAIPILGGLIDWRRLQRRTSPTPKPA